MFQWSRNPQALSSILTSLQSEQPRLLVSRPIGLVLYIHQGVLQLETSYCPTAKALCLVLSVWFDLLLKPDYFCSNMSWYSTHLKQ